MSAAALLEIEQLTFRRPRREGGFELHLPALELRRGQHLALVGESGSGKSTLLDLLGLILEPSRAARFVFRPEEEDVVDVAGAPAGGRLDRLAGLRRRAIGYVLQQGGLLSFLSILDNIRLVAPRVERGGVERLAEQLGISGILHKKPQHVSAGERQRAAIARALVTRPALLLADEPTGALDPPTARRVMRLVLELAGANGASLIVASHDWPLVSELGFPRLSPHVEDGPHGARSTFA